MTIQDNQKEFRVDGCAVTPGTFYAAACDPKRSVAVVACAGAGKTWILVSRIVRALLEGTKPQEILAITYTRKAAGEMRGRLEEFLSSMASPLTTDEERVKALMDRGLGRAEAAAACEQLRSLYARVLNYGRAIEVSTFHAWFARMLKAAPREVLEEIGVTNDVSLVEDVEELRPDLMAKFRETVSADEALSDDLGRVVARHGRSQVERWLDAALDKRVELELADKHDTLMDSVPSLGDGFPEFAALVSPSEYLLGDAGRDLIGSVAAELGMSKNSTPKKAAEGLEAAMSAASGAHALAAAKSAVLTKSCTVRAHLKAQRLDELAEVIARVDDAQQQVSAREDHQRMVRLSRAMLRDYGEYKRDRGLADMADLETVAQRLLSDATLAGWVQERLDARVRHVLVDEFQDTNPLQWRALASWLSAYAGSGGGAERPSVFLVGDPKQSIYRFRRAEPRVFAAAQRFVRETLNGVVLECNHTRRNAPEVVGALNGVFGVAKANGEFDGFASHTTEAGASGERHLGMTGIVLLDPVGRGEGRGAGVEVSGGWRPSLTEPRRGAEVVARAAEARKVALAIADLVRQGTRARDVMVLSRKRAGLVLVQQELEALDIKFEEAEARPLGDCAEVQDLLAAMDAVVSHTNDVAVPGS